MSFGNNLINYRKKLGITQEELAERLHVSRQTVSRWETDLTAPDLDILVSLSDIFGCSLDELVRGEEYTSEVEAAPLTENTEQQRAPEPTISASERRRHFSSFAIMISAGVLTVLIAVAAMMFIYSASEVWSIIALLSLIAAAVAMFVIGGVKHSAFIAENPTLPKYDKEVSQKFMKRSPFLFAGATVLILIGVILLILMSTLLGFDETEPKQMAAVGIFLLIVGVASALYTYTGMECSDFSDGKVIKDGHLSDEDGLSPKGKRINDAVSSAIMLTATAIFLLLGLTKNLWHPAWVVFPIGGILCGIVTSILAAIYPDKQ